MPPGTRIADYLDAIGYRQYSRSVILERRRLLGLVAHFGDDDWIMTEPIEMVVSTVRVYSQLRSSASLQKLASALEDYRQWRRRREGDDGE